MRFKAKYPVTTYRGTRVRKMGAEVFAVDFTALGQQERKRFKTLPEAKTWIDAKIIETGNKGRAAFTLDDRDRLDISEARKWLRVPLSEVFGFWKLHHPEGEQKLISAIIEEFLDAPGRRGKKIVARRESTVTNHRMRLASFLEVFGDRPANTITTADVRTWLDLRKGAALNRKHYLASARAAFNYAVSKQYVPANPALQIDLPDAKSEEPAIMTVDAVRRYLAAIETAVTARVHPVTKHAYRTDLKDLLPREAISFFCGVRPEELSRLDWCNVSLENKLITISGTVAKVQGHRRTIEMPDNLVAWLTPYVKASGPVWPYASATTLHLKRAAAQKAAGVELPDNAGRHAFASYHLAMHQNSNQTAELMGHSDVKLLKNVYRNIVNADGKAITKTMGEDFFKLMPDRMAGTVLAFKTA